MDDPVARFNTIVEKIKDNHQRRTPQRLAIVKILAHSEGHPSVEGIYRQLRDDFPTMSLATVYKTVSLVKDLGELLQLGFRDGSDRYDGNKPLELLPLPTISPGIPGPRFSLKSKKNRDGGTFLHGGRRAGSRRRGARRAWFSLKFCTEENNWDISKKCIRLTLPVFARHRRIWAKYTHS